MAALAVATGLLVTGSAETWDVPMAYPDGDLHTATGKTFAACVTEATGGEVEIVVHANGSLFKGNEIKRAVQTGQAPIGERLLSAHENQNPLFGLDAVPFLATSFEASDKLWQGARGRARGAPARAESGAGLRRAVAAAGLYTKQFKAKGMTAEGTSPELATDLKKIGETMTNDWLGKAGDDGRRIVEGYRQP